MKENMIKNNTPSSTVSLIQQQKEELEYLERLENEKKNKEKEDRLRAQKEV